MWDAPLKLVEVAPPTAAENLALDEAFFEQLEAQGGPGSLRLWECRDLAIILGRSSRLDDHVHTEACRRDGMPILHRRSGGGVVLLGPGCLCYTLTLPIEDESRRFAVAAANRVILQRIAGALRPLVPGIELAGTSDLVVGGRKVSGNAQRWGRHTLLHHGTLLYDFPTERVSRYLKEPARQPEYRRGRPHAEFLGNLPLPPETLGRLLAEAWNARVPALPPEPCRHCAAPL